MNNLITVKTAMHSHQLNVAKSYLEDNGIACFFKDEHMAEMHAAVASQGVQLQVEEENAEKALELLITGGFATKEEYEEYSDPLTRFVNKVFAKLGGKE